MRNLLFSILIVVILGWASVVWNETSPLPPERVVARYISAAGVADTTVRAWLRFPKRHFSMPIVFREAEEVRRVPFYVPVK